MPSRRPLTLLTFLLTLSFLAGCRPQTVAPSPPPFNPGAAPGQTSCDGHTLGPGIYLRSIEVLGRTRTYQIYVPQGYEAQSRTPVVLAFHGGMGKAGGLVARSGLPAKGDEAGFILVAPEGTGRLQTWNAGNCCGYARRNAVEDLRFVREMVAALDAELCLDPARIYATGHSNGAMLSYRLACEAADLIAAIAPIGGVMPHIDRNASPHTEVFTCRPSRPVPILHMHGTQDTCVRMEGGKGTGVTNTEYASVEQSMTVWRGLNACTEVQETTFTKGTALCRDYKGCAAPLRLCTAEGAGHLWLGSSDYPTQRTCGGATTTDLIANDHLWDFFAANPMP